MRKKLVEKSILCLLATLFLVSIVLPVKATEDDYDYSVDRKYKVQKELLDELKYYVCYCDLLNEDAMTGNDVNPITFDSVEDIDLYSKTLASATHADYTTKSNRYPESFWDITDKYDDAFFADNFLAVASMPLWEDSVFSIERVDYVSVIGANSSDNPSVSIILNFDYIGNWMPVKEKVKIFYVFFEVPREYYGGGNCVDALMLDWVTYNGGNPKTGDNAMLIPAMGAMVVSAAGIVITRKRRK